MKKIIFAFLLCVVTFSCNRNSKERSTSATITADMMMAPVSSSEAKAPLAKQISGSGTEISSADNIVQGTLPGTNSDWDKKIIRTANLKVEVKDFKSFSNTVHSDSKHYGAYIASEDQSESNEKKESTISIKVPVDQFENLLNELPSSSEKIIEKKITSEDVTGEVVDTKARLQAKEQMRLKYLEFLKQAKNMEDVLKVQGEINSIQEEMEAASGRINYLSHQSAYSTINVTFYEPLAGFNPSNDAPGFLTRTSDAFKHGFQFLSDIFVGLVSIWPMFLLGSIVWIVVKKKLLHTPSVK